MNRKWILILCFVVGQISCSKYQFKWVEFKKKFNKRYGTKAHEVDAEKVFEERMKEIEEHNLLFKHGNVTFEMGLHEKSDIPYAKLYRMRNGRKRRPEPPAKFFHNFNNLKGLRTDKLPEKFDWVEKGKVTEVKNQGQCGSCYAFSTAGALESQLLIKKNKRLNLSPQQIVDCSTGFGNAGCNGGFETNVFRYLIKAGGLMFWSSYPYRANKGPCKFRKSAVRARLATFGHLRHLAVNELKRLLISRGPICVDMDASSSSFMNYKSGIYYNPKCKNQWDDLDHAVLLVGYGSTNGIDYWKIKNSWGTFWGENGYFKIDMKGNNCGISTEATYPVLA